jgi:hypothetical protein
VEIYLDYSGFGGLGMACWPLVPKLTMEEIEQEMACDSNFHVNPVIFNMPQIYDMWQTALLPF